MKLNEILSYMDLTEVFNQPLPYTLKNINNTLLGTFDIDNRVYSVFFEETDKDIWIIGFTIQAIDGLTVPDDIDWDVEFVNSRKTSIKIFSTLIKITLEWIEKSDPKVFYFDTKEIKRKELYNKIVNYLEDDLNKKYNVSFREENGEWSWYFIKYGSGINLPKIQYNEDIGYLKIKRVLNKKIRKNKLTL